MNTHYGVIVFSGDPAEEHDDPDLRGHSPSMDFICAGPEQFCWDSLAAWTAKHPLRRWEEAEVLTRHPSVVRTMPPLDPPPSGDFECCASGRCEGCSPGYVWGRDR